MLTQKARYALHAALHLARKGEAATVAEIAEAEAIPRKFLESIMAALKTRGILVGRRGPSGGYQLARPASEITFAEILRCIDGPLALAPCVSQMAYAKCPGCKSVETCELRPILLSVRTTTALLLEGMSLSEAIGNKEISFI
jgi:Rrf2 family protein